MNTSAQPTPPFQPSRSAAPPSASRGAREPERNTDFRPSELRALLRTAPTLAELDDHPLDRLGEWCETLDTADGAPLFREGDECAGLYVVVTGEVRVSRLGSDGSERPLDAVGPGAALGDLPLLPGERHSTSAIATESARLLFLSRHVVESVYRGDPDVAQAIVESLSRRVHDQTHHTRALAYRDVASRLAVLLAGYAERRGTPAGVGVELELRRTQEELAHEIGAARESVSRAWGQLRDHGLIEPRRGHRVHIPDVRRLREVPHE